MQQNSLAARGSRQHHPNTKHASLDTQLCADVCNIIVQFVGTGKASLWLSLTSSSWNEYVRFSPAFRWKLQTRYPARFQLASRKHAGAEDPDDVDWRQYVAVGSGKFSTYCSEMYAKRIQPSDADSEKRSRKEEPTNANSSALTAKSDSWTVVYDWFGKLASMLPASLVPPRRKNVLVLGIENAGKVTLLQSLKMKLDSATTFTPEKQKYTTPSSAVLTNETSKFGREVQNLQHTDAQTGERLAFVSWEVGWACERFSAAGCYSHFAPDTIFVVDASTNGIQCIDRVLAALKSVFENDFIANARQQLRSSGRPDMSLLVLANKQDLQAGWSPSEIAEFLQLTQSLKTNQEREEQSVSAPESTPPTSIPSRWLVKGSSIARRRGSLDDSLDWLLAHHLNTPSSK